VTNLLLPTISVIIPVHNGGNSFKCCLESLFQSECELYEVIVVADGDTDGSWQLAETFKVSVIRTLSPGGPAKARNIGASAASGEILFFVDADVAIQPDTISQIADHFRQNPHAAALIGSYDEAPGAGNFLSQYKNLFHHYIHQVAYEDISTFWGACGAIRRDIFIAAGGFNEAYRFPSIEDIELGHRLKALGYNIYLYKSLQVKHLKCWTFRSLLKAEIFYRALPWTELILRERRMDNNLNLRWTDRCSILLVYSLLGGVIGTLLQPGFFGFVGPTLILFIVLNLDLYRFFLQKRGVLFTLRVLPCHWFYYVYCGFAFGVGVLRYWHSGLSARPIAHSDNQVVQQHH
jgi:glycosyltransferase involved in cell wall biosynthesis